MMKNIRWLVRTVVFVVFALIFFSAKMAGLYTDYLWFSQVGYITIFSTILFTKVFLFFFVTIISFLFFWVNNIFARKLSKTKIPNTVNLAGSAFLSLILGTVAMANWEVVLKALNEVPFHITDPIFSKDISFFMFNLPFYSFLLTLSMMAVVFALISAAVIYFSENLKKAGPKVTVDQYGNRTPDFSNVNVKNVATPIKSGPRIHLAILGSIFFAILALKHYFARYEIVYSTRGVIFGAGFTDATVSLPALTIMFFIAMAVALIILIWMFFTGRVAKLRKKHIVAGAIGIYLTVFVLGTIVIPGVVQYYKVSPNELDIEHPYIEYAINYTRMGYGLENVLETDFPVSQNLTSEDVKMNPETIDNIRLLDWRPLMQTYKQLQEIRLYYDFNDVDIDRYMVDGQYRQVMLSARELAVNQLAPQARTWLNEHVVYTHGYGVAMSPVNKVTKEGQPEFLIKDIPPQSFTKDDVLKIDRPEIYYGEHNNEFVLVGTSQREFDYPKGDKNMYSFYSGKGGVAINGLLSRLMIAIRYGDAKLLLSSAITKDSKILMHTNIVERINAITPFLKLDSDPYMVIAGGKLYWIQDAYTTSNRFPYSEPTGNLNYIRNSVKITVDAYDGTVNYYVQDPSDPLIQVYERIFPKQFKPIDEMPEKLRAHLRYPEALFAIQANKYGTYHMKNPSVFYNKEDVWDLPNEIYGQGQQVEMNPYYVILRLPDWDAEEFTLMIPFTPRKKDNMIAWLAAKSDANYGQLVVFKFPKDKLVYGPMQIEARIDQNADISEQLTLWSQKGSSVTRGNVLVIPLETSILYVEPLYIQADKSQMPELKRVIVSDGTSVVMEKSFGDALKVLLEESGQEKLDSLPVLNENGTSYSIADAQSVYEQAIEASQKGDWAAYGSYMNQLGVILNELTA